MQWNLKKMLPLAVTSLVAFSSFVYANDESAQVRNLDNRVTALEQRKGASGMINPTGRPQVRDGVDLFLYGDLLYWNAHENGLEVAVVNKGQSTNLANAKTKTIHGKWNWGFRVGAGYNSCHDGWDIRLTWLRFTDNGRKNAHAETNKFVYPSLVHPADPLVFFTANGAAQSMKSHWNMRLDQLDLDLGREFFVSKWLTLRPHFGLRADWIKQKLSAEYKNFVSLFSTVNQVNTSAKDRWWGMGLEGGLDTQWSLGKGWSLFGDLSAAILYGLHRMNYKDSDTPTVGAVDTNSGTYANIDKKYRISQPILDLQMGVRWDTMFSDDNYHLGLQIGWENHVYLNQFPLFVSGITPGQSLSNQGDLTMQGWTFEARFDF